MGIRIIFYVVGRIIKISLCDTHPPGILKKLSIYGLWTAIQIRYKTNLYPVLYKYCCGGGLTCEELSG